MKGLLAGNPMRVGIVHRKNAEPTDGHVSSRNLDRERKFPPAISARSKDSRYHTTATARDFLI